MRQHSKRTIRMTWWRRWLMNRQWKKLEREFPQYVRDVNGVWEMDMWSEPGIFSPAMKAAWARNLRITGSI